MPRIEFAPEVDADIERILGHLVRNEAGDAAERIREIIQAIDVLEQHPLIGRSAGGAMRELVIGRRARGYVALYRYVEELDTVFILALRGQREAGYASEV
jgi:plasmid stabilization system protein ParE